MLILHFWKMALNIPLYGYASLLVPSVMNVLFLLLDSEIIQCCCEHSVYDLYHIICFHFSWAHQRSGISGSYESICLLVFWELAKLYQSGYSVLHSYQQYIKFFMFLHLIDVLMFLYPLIGLHDYSHCGGHEVVSILIKNFWS